MDGAVSEQFHPVVLRFEGLSPSDLAGYEAHRCRRGGDLGHVDETRSDQNRRLIGPADWAERALEEVETIKAENFAAELEALESRKRRKDIQRRLAEGPHDPWRPTRHGPMRELILTANKEWFEEDLSVFFGEATTNQRVAEFERLAVDWLRETFGEDVIHARADLDEEAYHIHAVIMPRETVEMKRTDKATGEKKVIARRKMLQPSKFDVIRDYELAQDSVGEWFAPLGLTRGERRAQAIRDALENGRESPKKRRHVRPAEWRRRQEKELAEKEAHLEVRRREVEAREREADAVLAFTEGIASGELDESGREVKSGSVEVRADNPSRLPRSPALKASRGFGLARRAFRSALRRLRTRLEADARAEAERQVAEDLAEIRKADDIIVSLAELLPNDMRAKLASARRSLSKRIVGLERKSERRKRDHRRERSGPASDGEE
ncbi:plasmid recombination protein [Rhodovulum sp. YNF3179]|uniref:plasmid recombination protein n=1 Tax=Rhodovulum sp. YNF3179 TaxID=3425127 RepID=UPI003D34EB1E